MRLLKIFNLSYFLYQILWGMLYFQPAIIEKLPSVNSNLEREKSLARQLLIIVNNARTYTSENRQGVFTIKNITQARKDILEAQHRLPKFLNIKPIRILNIKHSLFQPIISGTGILGYYNPFTSEAQYRNDLPDSMKLFTIAHENAHQLGFSREQEANFVGYLIGTISDNPDLNYSARLFALKSLLSRIKKQDDDFVQKIWSQCSEGVKRDLENEKKFFEQNRGWLSEFFAFTNDLFLKSNQQEGSIIYSYFIDLLVAYESN